MIGRRGGTIIRLRETHGVNLMVEQAPQGPLRIITIVGSSDGTAACVNDILTLCNGP